MSLQLPQIVGLTGGIASGKSSVSQWLLARGFVVSDADLIAKEVVMLGEVAYQKVVERFGESILAADSSINRRKLGEIVFGDKTAREDLNAIIHPEVIKKLQQQVTQRREEIATGNVAEKRLPLILDVPLLFEAGLDVICDEVWLVWVTAEVQLKRLMERDGLGQTSAVKRIQAQMPLDEKSALADVIIDNSSTWKETERQLYNLIAKFE